MRRNPFQFRQQEVYEDPYASGRVDAQPDVIETPPSNSLMDAQNAPFLKLVVLFGLLAVLMLFSAYRLSSRGRWLPTAPAQIARVWSATEVSLSSDATNQIGHVPTNSYRYTNLFGERVDAHLISTPSFDAYHDPTLLFSPFGYGISAEKVLPLFGPNTQVRAIVLRDDSTRTRALMYYWIQTKSGVVTPGIALSDYQDAFTRLKLGVSSVSTGEQNCIVRVFTSVHDQDKNGAQARRNLDEVSRTIYQSLKQQASGGVSADNAAPTRPAKTTPQGGTS